MNLNRLSYLDIHFKYLLKSVFEGCKLLYKNYTNTIITFFFHNMCSNLIIHFKKIYIQIFIFIWNNDKRLLIRESYLLSSVLFKNDISFYLSKFFSKTIKFNILRSPFVYNKSKEHLGFNKYIIKLSSLKISNIFKYLFFKNLRNYTSNYTLLKFKIIFI